MCSDCTTRLDGVNTCRACVAARAASHLTATHSARLARRAPLAVALFAVVALEVYVTLYTLLLW